MLPIFQFSPLSNQIKNNADLVIVVQFRFQATTPEMHIILHS